MIAVKAIHLLARHLTDSFLAVDGTRAGLE